MELPLTELGTAVGALVALGWIVKSFLGHLKEKDSKFTEIISNHLTHSVKTQERLISAVEKLHNKL